MTCKECVHDRVCVIQTFPEAFENTQWEKSPCDHFAKASGWISVDERLPDCGGRFLTIDTEGRVSVDSYYAGMGWFCPSCNANDITHWMPLPERPKGE